MIACLLAQTGQQGMTRLAVLGIKMQGKLFEKLGNLGIIGLWMLRQKTLFHPRIITCLPVRIDAVGPVLL